MPVPMSNGEFMLLYAEFSHVLYVSCMPLLATESNTVFLAKKKQTPFLFILKWQVEGATMPGTYFFGM